MGRRWALAFAVGEEECENTSYNSKKKPHPHPNIPTSLSPAPLTCFKPVVLLGGEGMWQPFWERATRILWIGMVVPSPGS